MEPFRGDLEDGSWKSNSFFEMSPFPAQIGHDSFMKQPWFSDLAKPMEDCFPPKS